MFMLIYFDMAFFAVLKIIEGNNSTTARKVAYIMSYISFVLVIVAPIVFVVLLLKKFHALKNKEAKAQFNTLVLKIDKANKWRVINVAFFFGRRLITALLLTLPITTKFIFMQYVLILVTSHAYILYMVAVKPYQTPLLNAFVLANETFYSSLLVLIFIFSDATPQLTIKVVAGFALNISILLLVIANIAFIIYSVIKGRVYMKEKIKQAKEKRAQEEAKREREEKEKKEEDFSSKLYCSV